MSIDCNAWFMQLPKERQEVLREDKWVLAYAAFDAGKLQGTTSIPPNFRKDLIEQIDRVILAAQIVQESKLPPPQVDMRNTREREWDQAYPRMNIYSISGTEVVFDGMGGYPSQVEHAKKVLQVGRRYTVYHIDVGNSSSSVALKDVEGSFNTVMFAKAPQRST